MPTITPAGQLLSVIAQLRNRAALALADENEGQFRAAVAGLRDAVGELHLLTEGW